ncbi:MAG: NUDIX hydrolase, partial [bacterium]|nr:NUDIX hydrolase [bacterium]
MYIKRVSLIIPITRERKVLLQHKSTDAPNNPDTWCLFGGSIEEGESPEQAARREFKEELQVSVSGLNFFTKTF